MGNYSTYRRNKYSYQSSKNICKKLGLDEKSCWQLCCAAVLDSSRPLKNGQKRVDDFKKLIKQYEINSI